MQVAQRFDCLAVTLEMPFKDVADHPEPEQASRGEGGAGVRREAMAVRAAAAKWERMKGGRTRVCVEEAGVQTT